MFARRIPQWHISLRRAYSSGPNEELVNKIRQVIEEERHRVYINRTRVLIQGVEFISKLNYKLTSIEMAENLPVGATFLKLLADHLPSIANEVPAISEKKRKELIKELGSFPGLVPVRASRLILAGCRSKADVLRPEYLNMLPEAVQYSVRLASHLEKPVTRQKTKALADFMRDTLPRYEIIPVGSYRRGALTSASARILIIHSDVQHVLDPPRPPTGYFQPLLVETLVPPVYARETHLHSTIIPLLKEKGLVVSSSVSKWLNWSGILRVPKRGRAQGAWETNEQRVMGVKKEQGEFVRGMIFMLPSKSRGAAMLFHTGTKPFLDLIVHKATKLGLYFDHTGLWKWHPDPSEEIVDAAFNAEPDIRYEDDDEDTSTQRKKRKKGKKREEREEEKALKRRAEGFWQLLPSADEEMIFEQLGMEYVAPERRAVGI